MNVYKVFKYPIYSFQQGPTEVKSKICCYTYLVRIWNLKINRGENIGSSNGPNSQPNLFNNCT